MDHFFCCLVLWFSLRWTLRNNLSIEIKIGMCKALLKTAWFWWAFSWLQASSGWWWWCLVGVNVVLFPVMSFYCVSLGSRVAFARLKGLTSWVFSSLTPAQPVWADWILKRVLEAMVKQASSLRWRWILWLRCPWLTDGVSAGKRIIHRGFSPGTGMAAAIWETLPFSAIFF